MATPVEVTLTNVARPLFHAVRLVGDILPIAPLTSAVTTPFRMIDFPLKKVVALTLSPELIDPFV